MTRQAWQKLMVSFGIDPNEGTYSRLIAAYSEKHRAYHTCEHINACLQLVDSIEKDATHPEEIRLALWFHDAIYQPFSKSNEEDSADWAASFLSENDVPDEVNGRVHALIMATKHHDAREPGDQQLILDIDLSILGAEPGVFAQFEKDVRTEFKSVPGFIFKKKRRKILEGFLARPQLYHTPYFFDRLEQQARRNLAKAISDLA